LIDKPIFQKLQQRTAFSKLAPIVVESPELKQSLCFCRQGLGTESGTDLSKKHNKFRFKYYLVF